MTSTAGRSGPCRELTGHGIRMDDIPAPFAVRPALTEIGPDPNIEDADHAARYLTLCELVQRHVGEGTVLDVGCGSGRLYHYLTGHAGMRADCYTGIDICSNAVRLAAARFPEAGVGRRDYRHESVACRFDCVVFNDVLHCFDDPAAIFDKCAARNMHCCSVVIVCSAEGQHDILCRLLARRFRMLDEQTVRDGTGEAWNIQIFSPPKSGPGN